LLFFECVVDGVGANNMTRLITKTLITPSALSKEDMAQKLVSFGSNGVVMLQGIHTNVIMQIQEEYAPHMVQFIF
jgi:hypothetical protein